MAQKDWRSATIVGSLGADSAADQYPEKNLCGDCIAQQEAAGENTAIVGGLGPYDPSLGPECGLCEAEYDDDV